LKSSDDHHQLATRRENPDPARHAFYLAYVGLIDLISSTSRCCACSVVIV